MSEAYLYWKTAHILSATVLLGTGLGIAFFCWFGYRQAMRHQDLGALRAVLRLTVIADYCFTAPAVLVQIVSGVMLMRILDWSLLSPWALTVFGLFSLVGVCWLPVVALQVKLHREALRASSVKFLPAHFHRWFQWWFALGIPAFAIVVVIFYLMVAKPLSVGGA